MELLPFDNIILPVAGNVPNMDFIMGSTRLNQGKQRKSKKELLGLGSNIEKPINWEYYSVSLIYEPLS